MGKINVLSPQIFNLLAAGEVVENPASVVKECVENSLDAGASMVEISITYGGLSEIQITDNGSGIEDSEVEKVFLPHATSKISNEHDLESIKTLGFRGEAMSSIARVSKVTIISKTDGAKIATKLTLDGGEHVARESATLNRGTSISIKNLFFNTPARKKFLGSAGVERNNVTNTVQKLILSNPKIAFKYITDGEVYYDYKPSTSQPLLEAIKLIYGDDLAEALIRIQTGSPDYFLEGYISEPTQSKRNRSYQTTMINGRPVQGGAVSEATNEAMTQYMMVGQFPFFVLNLNVDEACVDVNIHPRKLQVKIEDEDSVKDFVKRAVSLAIDEHLYEKTKPLQSREEKKASTREVSPISNDDKLTKGENDLLSQIKFITSGNSANKIMTAPHVMKLFGEKMFEDDPTSPLQEAFADEANPFSVLGTVLGCYIIVSTPMNLILLDQHAAAERHFYDKLRAQVEDGFVPIQHMATPLIHTLTPEELNSITPLLPAFEEIGIVAEIFGKNVLRIRGVPALMSGIGALDKVIDGILGEAKKLKLSDMMAQKLITIACKNSLKGGRTLTKDQIRYFLDSLRESGVPPLCPHGRPVMVSLGKTEIEKMFKRK